VLAAGVTERIWACVSLQWDWLGGAQAPRGDDLDQGSRGEITRAA
jgi:hypothetical protein